MTPLKEPSNKCRLFWELSYTGSSKCMIFYSLKNIVWKSRLFMCCKMKTATELKIYHVIVRIKSGFLMLLELFYCLRSIYKPCNLYLQLTFNVFWVIFTFAWTLVMVIQLFHASCMLLLAFDIVFSPWSYWNRPVTPFWPWQTPWILQSSLHVCVCGSKTDQVLLTLCLSTHRAMLWRFLSSPLNKSLSLLLTSQKSSLINLCSILRLQKAGRQRIFFFKRVTKSILGVESY